MLQTFLKSFKLACDSLSAVKLDCSLSGRSLLDFRFVVQSCTSVHMNYVTNLSKGRAFCS